MSDSLPAEIVRTQHGHAVHYRLPNRALGIHRTVGWVLLVLGLCLCATVIYPAIKMVDLFQQKPIPPVAIFWFGGTVAGIIALICGYSLVHVGLFIVAGHSEIELRDGLLIVTERCGLIRWRWTRPTAGLLRFFVSERMQPYNTLFSWVTGRAPDERAVIIPEWRPVLGEETSRPIWIAPGYPRDWLVPLAQELASYCPPEAPDPAITALNLPPTPDASAVPVLERDVGQSEWEELAVQPVGSRIRVEASDEALLLQVPPPTPLRSGWLIVGGVASMLALCCASGAIQEQALGKTPWENGLFTLLFGGGGAIALAVGIWQAKHGERTIAVVDDTLILEHNTFWGRQRLLWKREYLADVFVHREHDSEGHDFFQLEIHPDPATGNPHRLLGELHLAELRWLATVLRRALRCPGHERNSPPAGMIVHTPPVHLPPV